MSKDFAFMFYPGEYLRDTQCLSEKTQVAYDRIMCEHMRNINISQSQLNFFTKRLSPDELNELMFVISKANGGFEIEWVARSIKERIAYSDSRRKNREGKPKEDVKTYDSHMVGEGIDVDKVIIDYEFIVKNYHELCPKMNKVAVINEIRKGFMNARVGEFGIEKVISVMRLAGESEFLNGINDKGWKADFEWILRPTNFLKIMEGKYKNNPISDINNKSIIHGSDKYLR
jgi:hypothetical protein